MILFFMMVYAIFNNISVLQVCFIRALQFPPPIKQTATI